MAYGITDSSQMIDYETIRRGCDEMRNVAHDFFNSGNKVLEAASNCTERVLSVDGETLQPGIEELGRMIKAVEPQVIDYADALEEAARQVLQAQQEELTQYKEAERKKKEEKQKKEESKKNKKKK